VAPGIDDNVPGDLRGLYDVREYRHASAILRSDFAADFAHLCDALRAFRFYESDILKSGGNESEIPKRFAGLLRPSWTEERLQAEHVVNGETVRSDSHKIDFVRGRVACDLEWNSKDQTFDRDLFAFRAFFEFDRISVGVLVTRSTSLNTLFKRLGILKKYGASTTHVDKLIPRLEAGRSGGCPVLVFGITEKLLKGE
jgi:hypothetical protein